MDTTTINGTDYSGILTPGQSPRIPADAFEDALTRAYIERDLARWGAHTTGTLSRDPHTDGRYGLIVSPTMDTIWADFIAGTGSFFGPALFGEIAIYDVEGSPVVIWTCDTPTGPQSNLGDHPVIVEWSEVSS